MTYMTTGVPEDIRTLFVRNMESMLIRFGYVTKENIDIFREDLTEELLYILECYTEDKERRTNRSSIDKYIDDCVTMRDLVYHIDVCD